MFQRLNLTAPPRKAPDPPFDSINVNPAKVEEVTRRTKEIIAAGTTPEWLFVCHVRGNLLSFQAGPEQPAVLFFTSPFGARDYLRVTGTEATVGQIKVETLPEAAQKWLAAGIENFLFNRCPRCKACLMGGCAT